MRSITLASSALLAALLAAPAGAQPVWSADGRLEEGDPREPDASRYDDHLIRLEAWRRYRISAASDDFDTFIRLYAAGSDEPVAENDDYDGLNSQIGYTPDRSGEYRLRVLAFSPEGAGAYAARAEQVPPLPPPVTAPGREMSATGSWSLWEGALGAGDPEVEGRHFDDYLVRLEAGRTYHISLESTEFDPLLQLLAPEARESHSPQPIDGDDDAGAGLNALLGFAPEASGDYVVRVTSYAPGPAGAYRLWISR